MLNRINNLKSSASFDFELTKSEYNRVRLMLVVLAFLLTFSVAVRLLLSQETISFFGNAETYFFVIGLLVTMLFFEGAVLWRIIWLLKRGLPVARIFRLLYSIIEVSFPSFLMWYMLKAHNLSLALESPLYLIYFLIILLSALHLDFRLSFVLGLMAAGQYSFLVFQSLQVTSNVGSPDNLPELIYYSRSALILLSGAAAGFVAEEIKKRVKSYLEIKDAKTELELTFGQQVSEKIAHALLEQGDQARPMEVTVMVLDIRDFTTFADNHLPGEILAYQNKVFGPILTIINQYDGVVNQILGDGVLAIFGAPVVDLQHAQKAYEASLAILEKVKGMCGTGEIPETHLGIALNSGEVITGNIGTEARKQYSFSGTPVIIAFRVEQLNKEFKSEFLITENVKNAVNTKEKATEYLGQKPLKGLNEEVRIYKIS